MIEFVSLAFWCDSFIGFNNFCIFFLNLIMGSWLEIKVCLFSTFSLLFLYNQWETSNFDKKEEGLCLSSSLESASFLVQSDVDLEYFALD